MDFGGYLDLQTYLPKNSIHVYAFSRSFFPQRLTIEEERQFVTVCEVQNVRFIRKLD